MDEKKTEHQIPTVELGGRFWEMRFSHKAMRRFCSMTKCRMSTFDDALDSYENHVKLLWCILWAQDEKVTLDQVNEWLDELQTMGEVIDLTQKCIAAAMPKRPDEEGKQAEDAENPTGETTLS